MPTFLVNILVLILITLLVLILANPIFAKKHKVVLNEENVIKNKKIDLKKIDFKKILLGIVAFIFLCPAYYLCICSVLWGILSILDMIFGFGFALDNAASVIAFVITGIIIVVGPPILAIITAIKMVFKK